MTGKIYIDTVILASTVTAFASYLAAAIIFNVTASAKRLILGSLTVSTLGSIAVVFCSHRLYAIILLLLLYLGTYLCFGIFSIRLSLGAVVCAALIGGVQTYISNMGIYGARGLIITIAVLTLLLFCSLKRIRTAGRLNRLTVYRGVLTARLTALTDTGNQLTGRCGERVIIAERQAVSGLFKNVGCDLRLVPYKTIDGRSGAVIGILCDRVYLNGKNIGSAIIAPVDGSLGDGVYNALINPETEVI